MRSWPSAIATGSNGRRSTARSRASRVDFLFANQRLVVEADRRTFHRSRRAFERDRERDAILARAGYRTLRFTHRQLTREPAMVAETITK